MELWDIVKMGFWVNVIGVKRDFGKAVFGESGILGNRNIEKVRCWESWILQNRDFEKEIGIWRKWNLGKRDIEKV